MNGKIKIKIPKGCTTDEFFYKIGLFDLELIYICTGNSCIPAYIAPTRLDDFAMKLEYICDENCSCVDLLAKAFETTSSHCIGDCSEELVEGFATDGLTLNFKRTNLGKINVNYALGYDCSTYAGATNVDATNNGNNTGINLKRAYPGDVMGLVLNGEFAGVPANYISNNAWMGLLIRHSDKWLWMD